MTKKEEKTILMALNAGFSCGLDFQGICALTQKEFDPLLWRVEDYLEKMGLISEEGVFGTPEDAILSNSSIYSTVVGGKEYSFVVLFQNGIYHLSRLFAGKLMPFVLRVLGEDILSDSDILHAKNMEQAEIEAFSIVCGDDDVAVDGAIPLRKVFQFYGLERPFKGQTFESWKTMSSVSEFAKKRNVSAPDLLRVWQRTSPRVRTATA